MTTDPIIDRITAADPERPPTETTAVEARVRDIVDAGVSARSNGRPRRVALLVAAVLTLTAGTAVATGIPDRVIDSLLLELPPGWGEAARDCVVEDPESIRRVATAQLADGEETAKGIAELYAIRSAAGQLITTLTETAPDGTSLGSTSWCGVFEDSQGQWAYGKGSWPGSDHDAGYAVVSGQTTLDSEQVRVELETGGSIVVDVQDDGYFLEVVPGDPRPFVGGSRPEFTPVE